MAGRTSFAGSRTFGVDQGGGPPLQGGVSDTGDVPEVFAEQALESSGIVEYRLEGYKSMTEYNFFVNAPHEGHGNSRGNM